MFQSDLVLLVFSIFLYIHPQGLPNKKVLLPTVPESPAFALKKRVHKEPRVEEVRTPFLRSQTVFVF